MHKCQGMSQLLPLPATGGSERFYRLRDTVLTDGVDRNEREIFDGVDTRLVSLASYAGPNAPALLTNALERIAIAAADARKAMVVGGNASAIPALARGLAAVRELRSTLSSMGLDEPARYEIDFRLRPKEDQFSEALILAADIRI